MAAVWFTLGAGTVLLIQRTWRRLVWGLLSRGDE